MSIYRACVAAIGLAVSAFALAQNPPDNESWPLGEKVLDKYKAGKFSEVIAEAPATLVDEPWNHELRFAYANSLLWSNRGWEAAEQYKMLLDTDLAVDARLGLANSLAWNGKMAESLPHYRMLLASPKAGEAKLGLANAQLWMGRADLSLPLFEELRAAYPDKDVGVDGLILAQREVRPRTSIGAIYAQDNLPTRRFEPLVSQTWRGFNNSVIFGIDGSGGHDWGEGTDLQRREYGFRVESLDTPFSPRIAVSRQTDPQDRTFGDLRLLAVPEWPLYVGGGRVNWGKLSFRNAALEQGLTANRFGIEGRYPTIAGEIRGFANYYDISDGNHVANGDVRITSAWRPWGREIRPFTGVQWRYSGHVDPDYWSPKEYLLGYVGIEGVWEKRDWTVAALGQVGFKLAGDAREAWGVSLTAKRWFGDFAIGASAYALAGTQREGYRGEGASLLFEMLW